MSSFWGRSRAAALLACAAVFSGNAMAASTCLVQFLGPDRVDFDSPAQVLPEGFAVRITDTAGKPVAGVALWMFVDYPVSIPELPPGTVLTPPATFGRFDSSTDRVLTGSDGIARSAAFIGGTVAGNYSVAVTSNSATGDNAALCGTDFAYFRSVRIAQGFGSVAIPAVSPWGQFALLLGIVGIAWVSSRRFRD